MVTLYLGTYTAPGKSEGVYTCTLDPATGTLSAPILLFKTPNPSCLALSPDKNILYAVQETGEGGLVAYSLHNPGSTPSQATGSTAAGPCHLALSPDGASLITSSYSQGRFHRFSLESPLVPTLLETHQNQGSSLHPDRQTAPHTHCFAFHPEAPLAFGIDLGTDEILLFKTSPFQKVASVKTSPGSGPRHIVVHPDGTTAYVNAELTNEILVYQIDPEKPTLNLVQKLPTLPPQAQNQAQNQPNTTAAVLLHPDRRHLFVSNRGHDSLAQYWISADNTLALHSVPPLGLQTPRGVALSPCGKWLLAAGQSSHDLLSYPFDPEKGTVGPAVSRQTIHSPVYILPSQNNI